MRRTRKIIIVGIPAVFLLIVGSTFYLFYLKKEVLIEDKTKEQQITETSTDQCLGENKFVDYVIDKNYPAETKVPALPLTILIEDKTINKQNSFQIDNTGNPRGPRPQLHKCGVYVTRILNYDYANRKPLVGYKTEIWKYDYTANGNALVILDEDSLGDLKGYKHFYSSDFRVSPTESYVVLEKSYLGKDDYALVIKDLNTKQDIFTLLDKDIAKQYPNIIGSLDMLEWSKDSRYFWGSVFDGAYVNGYFRIDVSNGKVDIYEAPNGAMGGSKLNISTGYLPIQPGQIWTGDVDFDQINKERLLKEGKKSELYLYNLFTKENIFITSVADNPLWWFKSQWLSDTELQYELPSGEKKIYKIGK